MGQKGHTITATFLLLCIIFTGKSYCQVSSSDSLDLRYVVETTLSKNLNIKLKEQDVINAKGTYLSGYGTFDPYFTAGLNFNRVFSPEYSNDILISPLIQTSNFSMGLAKPFDWGGILSLQLQMTRTFDSTDNPGVPNIATIGVQFELPLLRGLGESGTAGDVLSDKYSLQAEQKDYLYAVSGEILNSIQGYWNYLAAKRNYEIIGTSLGLAEEFYSVNSGSNDISTLQATISQKKIDLSNAQQDLYTARHTLGLSMGIDNDEIESLPLPRGGGFLKEEVLLPDSSFIMNISVNNAVEVAFRNRQDYLASLDRVTASDYEVRKTQNGTLSELDLTLSAGYTGRTEGERFDEFFNPLYKNVEGMNFGATLSYKLPFGNNTAEGNLVSAAATYTQNKISSLELRRQIRSAVSVQLKQMQTSYLNFLESQRVILHSLQALQVEQQKLQEGNSTSINVDYVEKNLVSARLTNIKAMQNLANDIVKLKHVMGILVNAKGEVNYVDVHNLMKLK